jgi:hypothetical protein
MGVKGRTFYLHVSSADSLPYFPNNKPDNFRVKLSKPLNLTGCWKIGLCEIRLANVTINKVTRVKRTNNKVIKGVSDVDTVVKNDVKNDDMLIEKVNVKCMPSVSIDCNICTGLIVNGIQTRTLRKVWGKKNIYKVYPLVYYVPVEKVYIDTIEFNIYSGVDRVVTFDAVYGLTEMVLRLKSC